MSQSGSNSEILLELKLNEENWQSLAATAWYGYKSTGRGVVLLDITKLAHDTDVGAEATFPLNYLPLTRSELRSHIEQNDRLRDWLNSFDPETDSVVALGSPEFVFYTLIETPASYLTLQQAYSIKREEVSDALELDGSALIKEWPDLAAIAILEYAKDGLGEISISLPEPTTEDIQKATEWGIERAAKEKLIQLKQQSDQLLSESQKMREGFENRLHQKWAKGFNLFETFLVIVRNAGSDFNKKWRDIAVLEQDFLFEVLTRLHARACVTGSEILTLLRTGHADGAIARWRMLHEIAVVSFFISQNGRETAKRYLQHEYIESFKAMEEYQKYCSRLKQEEFDVGELEASKKEYDRLQKEYGDSYPGKYGWASDAIRASDPTFRGRVTFEHLEKAVHIDHLRPYYRMASHWVHAGPKSVAISLGVRNRGTVLIAGPSDIGRTDPAHCASISLLHVTTSLLNHKPGKDTLAITKALPAFVEEIGDTFLAIEHENRLGADE